jgi:hypothetical protein
MDIFMGHLRSCGLFDQYQPDYDDDEEEDQCELEQPQEQPSDEPAAEEPKDEVLSLLVFSSRTDKWESQEFASNRCAPHHLYDILIKTRFQNYEDIWKSAEYWQRSLYVHCHKNVLMILRNFEEMYDLVQLPGIPLEEEEPTGMEELRTRSVLANYDKGIIYVTLNMFQLQVWELNEPADGKLGWTLTHEADLSPYNHRINHSLLSTQSMVPWKMVEKKKATLSLFEPLSDYEQRYVDGRTSRQRRRTINIGKDLEYLWDSDEDNFIDMDESTVHLYPPGYSYYTRFCRIIGLHPHKDVLLLHMSGKATAYHLSTSRMQYLGKELISEVNQCTQLHFCYGVKRVFP